MTYKLNSQNNESNSSLENYNEQFGQVITSQKNTDNPSKPNFVLIGSDKSIDLVRKELFSLSRPIQNCQILDLGNMDNSSDGEFIALLTKFIYEGSIPILVSSNKDLATNHLNAILQQALISSLLVIHPSMTHDLPINGQLKAAQDDSTIKWRLLAHQTHLTPPSMITWASDHKVDCLRLGMVRQYIEKVEPWCRSLEHAMFFTESLRKTDFPPKQSNNPGGLYYEEACKISQFIGSSSHLQSVGIYGYSAERDHDHSGAATIAQLIWYLIDGHLQFKEEKNIEKSKLTQFIVHAGHQDLDIHFWKNNESGRWWMEVPGHEHHWVSCTYEDYLEASQGEFSSRLIKVLNQ